MRYTVLWMPIAEEQLAAIWASASDRDAVTRASHVIDQALRSHPEEAGESRVADVRVLFETPLGALFTVSPEDRAVRVLSVWKTRPRH